MKIRQNENFRLTLLTILYLAILFTLFWIYGGGGVGSNFIYNEF